MFSYYGTKRSLAPFYPAPDHDTIIEPFAGAAAYSLLYPDRQVRLFDLDPIVVATWAYLIGATKSDILGLPDLMHGDRVADLDVPTGARYLMGFAANPGSAQPKITATARCKWNNQKLTIAALVPKIKHWTVECRSWQQIPNTTATWFVDPPYQKQGKYYRKSASDIDFDDLADFCLTRQGSVIVCEQDGADWLSFDPFRRLQGQRHNTQEVWWYRRDLAVERTA